MRLYRALTVYDFDSKLNMYVLSSNSRAFEKDKNINNILSNKINLPNEIYSHIMNTHRQSHARAARIIYSFTDDYNIACSFLNKYPNEYKAIGYIDINENLPQIKEDGIYFIFPAHSLSAWVNLAAYFNTEEIQNVTNGYRTRLAYTLIPSQKSMLSWAKNKREYAVICKNLILTLCTKESEIKSIENKQKIFVVNRKSNDNKMFINKEYIKKVLKRDIGELGIQEIRKEYVLTLIDAS